MLDIASRLTASISVFYPQNTEHPSRPVLESVRKIVEAGLGVELWNSEAGVAPYSEEAVAALAELCRSARYVTVHTGAYEWDPCALCADIGLAARFGASVLVVHPGTLGLGPIDTPSANGEVRDICRRALDARVLLALENGGRTGISMLTLAMDLVGGDPHSTGLGICIDTGHANRSHALDGVATAGYLDRFRDVIVEVHVNDNLGGDDLHLPPGEGNIDWQETVPAIRRLRGDALICLELNGREQPIETLRSAAGFLCGGES